MEKIYVTLLFNEDFYADGLQKLRETFKVLASIQMAQEILNAQKKEISLVPFQKYRTIFDKKVHYRSHGKLSYVIADELFDEYIKANLDSPLLLITDSQLYQTSLLKLPLDERAGTAYLPFGFAIITTRDWREKPVDWMAKIVLHEIGHLYGLKHHYHNISLKEAREGKLHSKCVMDDFKMKGFDQLRLYVSKKIKKDVRGKFHEIRKVGYCERCLQNFKTPLVMRLKLQRLSQVPISL